MKLNSKVLIVSSPLNYAEQKIGKYKGKYLTGFKIEIDNPKGDKAIVWAEKIKKAEKGIARI